MAVLNKPDYVSIILVHYSQRDDNMPKTDARKGFLRRCVSSIERNTDYPAELIVIDNGGEDDDSDYLLGKVREGTINTYIRNKNNMFFGWAWNQGIKLATSEFIVLTCNDIEFRKNWLTKTMYPLLNFDRKLVSSPVRGKAHYDEEIIGDYALNKWAGSDCVLLTKDIYNEVGEFSTHHLAGSQFQKRLIQKGYNVITPIEHIAKNLGARRGLHLGMPIKVKEDLLCGGVADFSASYKGKIRPTGGVKYKYDRANTPDYWNKKWSSKKTRVETYSMNRTLWHIDRLKPRSVLDIGCGNGRLLAKVDKSIYRFGIDISKVAIQKMWDMYGVEGKAMNAYEVHRIGKKFDFIAANHLLEHLWKDKEFLMKCKSVLNKGGHFIAAVPNNMSFPEDDEEHVRAYDWKMMEDLFMEVFGNVEMSILGNHLIGLSKND